MITEVNTYLRIFIGGSGGALPRLPRLYVRSRKHLVENVTASDATRLEYKGKDFVKSKSPKHWGDTCDMQVSTPVHPLPVTFPN
jgi:hypothetical protein